MYVKVSMCQKESKVRYQIRVGYCTCTEGASTEVDGGRQGRRRGPETQLDLVVLHRGAQRLPEANYGH